MNRQICPCCGELTNIILDKNKMFDCEKCGKLLGIKLYQVAYINFKNTEGCEHKQNEHKKTAKCINCKYFQANGGFCRRYPEYINREVNDWCGEYQYKE